MALDLLAQGLELRRRQRLVAALGELTPLVPRVFELVALRLAALVEMRQFIGEKSSAVLIRRPLLFLAAGQHPGPRGAGFASSAIERNVEYPGRHKPFDAEKCFRLRQMLQHAKVGQQLQFQPMIQLRRVQLPHPRFVIHHHGERGIGIPLQQVHAINPPAQRQRVAVAKINPPRGHLVLLVIERDFAPGGIKLVLRHPLDQRHDEPAQALDQKLTRKPRRAAGLKLSVAELRQLLATNVGDKLAGFGWREIAPLATRRDDPPMKLLQRVMLEAALVAVVELEFLALLQAQSARREKLERARRKILQSADGRLQLAPENMFHDCWRKRAGGIGELDLPPFFQHRAERRELPQGFVSLHLQRRRFEFAEMFAFPPGARTGERFFGHAGDALDVVKKRRRIEQLPFGVLRGARQDEALAGPRDGDVAEITFVAEPLVPRRAQINSLLLQPRAIRFRKQRGGRGRRGENALVQTEHEREFQLRIARAINGANQHLIQRRRHDPDREIGEAGFEDGQPVAQRQRLGRERPFQIVEPVVHLFEHGGVNGGLAGGATGSGGQCGSRSAEWHSAVSRIGNPHCWASSGIHGRRFVLPNTIRRHSRLTICATKDRHFRSRRLAGGRLTPALQGFFHVQFTPQFTQSRRDLSSVWREGIIRERSGEGCKRRDELAAQRFQSFSALVFMGDGQRLAPDLAFPAAGQRLIFQLVNRVFARGDQAALECAEPVVVPPTERHRANGKPREFRQRVVRHRRAPIHEERNFVAPKYAGDRGMIGLQPPHNDRAIAKPPARADMPPDFPRGQHGFTFRVGADGEAKVRGQRSEVRGRTSDFWLLTAGLGAAGLRPVCFQVPQRLAAGKPALIRFVGQCLDADLTALAVRQSGVTTPKGLRHHRPRREPRRFGLRFAFQTKRQRGLLAKRQQRGEQIQLLGRHLRKTVEPQRGNAEGGGRRVKRGGGHVEQMIGVLEFMGFEPVAVRAEQEREVVQFGAQRRWIVRSGGQFRQS